MPAYPASDRQSPARLRTAPRAVFGHPHGSSPCAEPAPPKSAASPPLPPQRNVPDYSNLTRAGSRLQNPALPPVLNTPHGRAPSPVAFVPASPAPTSPPPASSAPHTPAAIVSP